MPLTKERRDALQAILTRHVRALIGETGSAVFVILATPVDDDIEVVAGGDLHADKLEAILAPFFADRHANVLTLPPINEA